MADPLEFLAQVLVHVSDKGHFTRRGVADGMRTEATQRWAALELQIFEVDPLRRSTHHRSCVNIASSGQ